MTLQQLQEKARNLTGTICVYCHDSGQVDGSFYCGSICENNDKKGTALYSHIETFVIPKLITQTAEVVRAEEQDKWIKNLTPELFHETYERLAPAYEYETRKETKEFDRKSKNGRLMLATIRSIALTIKDTKDE